MIFARTIARLRQSIASRIRYKITRGGMLFTAAIVVVGAAAVFTGDNPLFLIVAAMMATLLVSGFVSRLCLAGLELDFLVPEHVAATRVVPGRLYVRNRKWFLPSFSTRVTAVQERGSPALASNVYFPLIAAGATLDETVEICFSRRGSYKRNTFAFTTSFPFGFLERSARVTLLRETLVYPAIDPQPGFEELLGGIAGDIETHYRGLGRDFYRIRPYEATESARFVDWKATAHAGVLQVREFAREREQTVEMFLDRNIAHDFDAWFEHAIDCCAFLVWRLTNQGVAIHFRSNGFALRQPDEGDVYAILKYLALVYAQNPARPQGCATEPPIDESSFQVVFTATPERFRENGWTAARILSPADLPAPLTAPPDPPFGNATTDAPSSSK
jgi:uncharacterized protein (DUF58 family)